MEFHHPYSSYKPHQPTRSESPKHSYQSGGYDHGLGCLQPQIGFGNQLSNSTIDVRTRLVLLEKNYYDAQAENTKKQADIQNLLRTKIYDAAIRGNTDVLREEVLNVQEKVFQLANDIGCLWGQVGTDLKTILAVSESNSIRKAFQPTSATGHRDKASNQDHIQTHALIDFQDCHEEFKGTQLSGGDTTVLENYHNNQSGSEGVEQKAHAQSITFQSKSEPNYDLIDLGNCHEDFTNTQLKDGDATVLEDYYNNWPGSSKAVEQKAHAQSLTSSFNREPTQSPYISQLIDGSDGNAPESYNHQLPSSKEVEQTALGQSLNSSFNPELSFPPYIFHFVDDSTGNGPGYNNHQVDSSKQVKQTAHGRSLTSSLNPLASSFIPKSSLPDPSLLEVSVPEPLLLRASLLEPSLLDASIPEPSLPEQSLPEQSLLQASFQEPSFPAPSLPQPSFLEFPPYIFHFVNDSNVNEPREESPVNINVQGPINIARKSADRHIQNDEDLMSFEDAPTMPVRGSGHTTFTNFNGSSPNETLTTLPTLAKAQAEKPVQLTAQKQEWKKAKFQPLELKGMLLCHQSEMGVGGRQYPEFFKYGIRYDPMPGQRDVYRTVCITGLPSDITLMRLMERVRGGMVVDVKLLDTTTTTKSMTALVIFLHGHAAIAYERFAWEHPINFNGTVARVTMVTTPTWPLPRNLRVAISKYNSTRCLEVHNFNRKIPASALRGQLTVAPQVNYSGLESMRMSEEGVLGLRFSSIKWAAQASAMFNCTTRYAGCSARYVADPCAQRLETLL